MKSGTCPKCGSSEIYQSPQQGARGYVGNWIFIKFTLWKNKGAYLIHYACAECQYIESYVADDASMRNIREEWIPLNLQKAKRKNEE